VVTVSPLEKSTLTSGVSLPLKSNTANVARSPLTNFFGSSRIRAPAADGAAGAVEGFDACWPKHVEPNKQSRAGAKMSFLSKMVSNGTREL
jgi:hypothetical protein